MVRTEIGNTRSLQAHDFLADRSFDSVIVDPAMSELTDAPHETGQLLGAGVTSPIYSDARREAFHASLIRILNGAGIVTQLGQSLLNPDASMKGVRKFETSRSKIIRPQKAKTCTRPIKPINPSSNWLI